MIIKIDRLNASNVTFNYYWDNGKSFRHTIEYPDSIYPSDDALFRISLFSRPDNSKSYSVEGVSVNESVRAFFQLSLKASIKVTINNVLFSKDKIQSLPEDSFLCFSGGFDSVSSKAILEDSFNLISIDFGGGFKRESLFFEKFDTNIIKWDIRRNRQKIKYNESLDWRFLLSPVLLFSKENKPIAIGTGAIMEASPYWFTGLEHPKYDHYGHGGYGYPVALISPVACITEYSTTLIAKEYLGYEQLQLSLDSLAAPNSQKAFRKEVLLSLVTGSSLPAPPQKAY